MSQGFYRFPPPDQITAYPEPTGPFPMGTVARLVPDPSRSDRYTPHSSSFMIQICVEVNL